jgi:hypothetical protein
MSPAGLGPMNTRLGESPYLALSGNPQSLAGGPMTARGTLLGAIAPEIVGTPR